MNYSFHFKPLINNRKIIIWDKQQQEKVGRTANDTTKYKNLSKLTKMNMIYTFTRLQKIKQNYQNCRLC